MAALTCDICGGKLVMGSGGIAACDSCGMEYTQDRMREKIQEIKGVVRVDNSHMIDNWMRMGMSAAQAGNNQEAYSYFTKVIEIDPNNWRAIFEKGKAGAWQSTLGNLRISELYQGIFMALEIIERTGISQEELVDITNEFAVALFNINNAITDLMDQNLYDLSDKYFDAHWDQMCNTRQRYITNVSQLEDAMSLIAEFEDDLSKSNVIEFKKRMCVDLRSACFPIQYWTDYSQSRLGYLGFEPNEKKPYLDKYWKLVDEIREVEPGFATVGWPHPDPFGPGFHDMNTIDNYWRKIELERKAKREKEAQQKRFEKYWKEHAEDKKRHEERIREIDAEIMRVNAQYGQYEPKISEIKKELNNPVPAESQLSSVKKQHEELRNQKSKLGIFAGTQKKQLQEQIDALQSEIASIEETVKQQRKAIQDDVAARLASIESERKPLKDQYQKLEAEKRNIKNELTKAR